MAGRLPARDTFVPIGPREFLFVAVLALALGACSGGDGPAAGEPPATWTGPELREGGALPHAAFDRYAESVDASWERSALLTAAVFLGLDRAEAASTTVVARGGEGRPMIVRATLDGLFDDSIRSLRYVATLRRREDGTWRVLSARWTQRCQRRRGHQAFTAEPCL